MPSHQLKDEKIRELTDVVEGWGRILAEQAYGPQGPGLDVDLAGMEDLGVAMQHALIKGLCEELTQRQAEGLPKSQPCPNCGRECQAESPEKTPKPETSQRTIQLRHGTFELSEPRFVCRSCNRSFFPSADPFADRQPQPQPRG